MLQPIQTTDGMRYASADIQQYAYRDQRNVASVAGKWIRKHNLHRDTDYWKHESGEYRSDGIPSSVRYEFSLDATLRILRGMKKKTLYTNFCVARMGQVAAEPVPMPYYNGQYDPMTNRCVSLEPMALEPTIIHEETEMQVVEPEVIEEPTMALTLWERVERSVITDEYPFPVLGRELQVAVGNRQDYTSWIKYQIKRLPQFIENTHFRVLTNHSENPKGGRPSINHELCREMAKHIALIAETEEGFNIRTRIIAIEEQFTHAVQTGTLPGLSEAAMANVLGQVQQGTLTVLAKLEEYKHEDRMAAARAEDRYMATIEAYHSLAEKALELAKAVEERRVVPQPETKPTPKIKVVYNMIKAKFGSTLTSEKRKLIYAKTQEVAEKYGKPYVVGPVPGFLYKQVNQTTQGVFEHSIKELAGQLN